MRQELNVRAGLAWNRQPLIHAEISIEIPPEQARQFSPDPGVFPRGSRVYLPHLKGKALIDQVEAARKLKEMGYVPVPHFGARNFETVQEYVLQVEAHIRNGVTEALFLGGNPLIASGPLSSASELLAHPVLAGGEMRVAHIGGYPEGHPAISDATLHEAMLAKLSLCGDRGIHPHIVSQFAFNGAAIGAWAKRIHSRYPGIPIHVGLAGVTSLPKLIKFAMMCGVGPSLAALRRSSIGLMSIVTDKTPEDIVENIESAYPSPVGPLSIHFFPFGGWQKTLDWVKATRSDDGGM